MKNKFKNLYRCEIIENIDEIKEKWKKVKTEQTILIDVRSPQEYEEGHISGAISIPDYDIEEKIFRYIKNKNTPIAIYCNTGTRSKKVYEKLKEMGLKKLIQLS